MATKEKEQELIKRLQEAVINYRVDDARKAAEEAIKVGADAYTMTMEGLAGGMEVVSQKFDTHEYFVPETLLCAKALYAALDILKPHIKTKDEGARGQVVLGVMQGDVHDLGKNLIKAIFESSGWTVHDLGRDVPLQKFVEEQLKTDSDIVMLSAMMTTSMVGIKKLIPMIKEKNPKVKIMIGGAPDHGEDRGGVRSRRHGGQRAERPSRSHEDARNAAKRQGGLGRRQREGVRSSPYSPSARRPQRAESNPSIG